MAAGTASESECHFTDRVVAGQGQSRTGGHDEGAQQGRGQAKGQNRVEGTARRQNRVEGME